MIWVLSIWSIFWVAIGWHDLTVGAINTSEELRFSGLVILLAAAPWAPYIIYVHFWGG